MKHRVDFIVIPVLMMAISCDQDIGFTPNNICDGVAQQGEDWVDQPFDKDGDGFFDGSNSDCIDNYASEFLDCNDNDPDVHPEAMEISCDDVNNDCDDATPDAQDFDEDGWDECDDCNDSDASQSPGLKEEECDGIDNDCDPTTPDSVDADADGVDSCDDCNDKDPTAYPGRNEECDDKIDNDCDGEVDEDCQPADYSGDYDLDTTVSYSCAWGSVNLSFAEVNIVDSNPDILVKAGSGQPGQMSGTRTSSGYFSASRTISGTCDETYTMSGQFTSDTTFDGTFEAAFTGGSCYDCTTQSWEVSGTKQ